MVYFNINESDSYHIIREWLVVYVYAEFPVSDSAIDGLSNNLVASLKRGIVVGKEPTTPNSDTSSL